MISIGRSSSKVASRQNLNSASNVSSRDQELIERSFSYQTQAYLDHTGFDYLPLSAQGQVRRRSPALRNLEKGTQRN